MEIIRALSIRQPYAELIMRGKKKIEYRSRPTNIRERVYIYASLTPGDMEYFCSINKRPGDLPTGVIIGSVEIVDCRFSDDEYHWHLKRPQRLDTFIIPERQPQPAFFFPFKENVPMKKEVKKIHNSNKVKKTKGKSKFQNIPVLKFTFKGWAGIFKKSRGK